jgi:hypothetical protein
MALTAVNGAMRTDRNAHHERAVRAVLRDSPYTLLRRVHCYVIDCRIVLCGTVPSYYLKQVAQCLLLKRFGAEFRVENRLKVKLRRTKP